MVFMLGLGSVLASIVWVKISEKVWSLKIVGVRKILTFLALVCGLYAIANGFYHMGSTFELVRLIFEAVVDFSFGSGGEQISKETGTVLDEKSTGFKVKLVIFSFGLMCILGFWQIVSVFFGFCAALIAAGHLFWR